MDLKKRRLNFFSLCHHELHKIEDRAKSSALNARESLYTHKETKKKWKKEQRTKGDRKGRREEGAVNEPKPIKQDRTKHVKRLLILPKKEVAIQPASLFTNPFTTDITSNA